MALSEIIEKEKCFQSWKDTNTTKSYRPFGSVQRMISNMLPTSLVECINTKNENSEMNKRKFLQFPSQYPLTASGTPTISVYKWQML